MTVASAAPPSTPLAWTLDEALGDQSAWARFRRYGFLVLRGAFEPDEV